MEELRRRINGQLGEFDPWCLLKLICTSNEREWLLHKRPVALNGTLSLAYESRLSEFHSMPLPNTEAAISYTSLRPTRHQRRHRP